MGSSSVMKRLPSPLYELRHSIAAGPRRALGAHGLAAADEAAVVARAARGDPDLIALGEHGVGADVGERPDLFLQRPIHQFDSARIKSRACELCEVCALAVVARAAFDVR